MITVIVVLVLGGIGYTFMSLLAMGVLKGILKPMYPTLHGHTKSNLFMGGFMIGCFATLVLLESAIFWIFWYYGTFNQIEFWHYPMLIGANLFVFYKHTPGLIMKMEID